MTLAELRDLANDPLWCIPGTPQIPLHRDELLRLLAVIEAADAAHEFWYDGKNAALAKQMAKYAIARASLEQKP